MLVGNRLEVVHPCPGHGVGRHSPVTARAQGPTGDDLGSVGQGGALELVSDESTQEQPRPVLDGRQVIGMAVLVMEPGWPGPHRGVAPGVMGQKDDPAGTHPVAQ